jgi:hypothetical protein
MHTGRLATILFCVMILLLGFWFSKPKTLLEQFAAAGLHPELNSSRDLLSRSIDGQPILSEYHYVFDKVPSKTVISVLQKAGYKVNFVSRPPLVTTRMIKMNSLFNWRVDDSLEVFEILPIEHFPGPTTMLILNRKLK